MANYATLKTAIQAVIYENGNQEITGEVMQATLLSMVNSLGANFQYAGIATPTTNPGTPDQNVFYLAATAGTYANFGNIVLAENEVAILKYNGSWTKETSGFASAEKVNQLSQDLDSVGEKIDAVGAIILVNKTSDATITTGAFLQTNGTPIASSAWEYLTMAVSPGQKYTISAVAGQIARLWLVYDSNGNRLGLSTDSSAASLKTETITIPENGAILYVNARISGGDARPTILLQEYFINAEKVVSGQTPILVQYGQMVRRILPLLRLLMQTRCGC